MRIYIASSWKNQHAVEMLTALLRQENHEVLSFIENSHGEQKGHEALDEDQKPMDFTDWIWSPRGSFSFIYDTDGATLSDLVIYISPSGSDAWAEIGAAWGKGVPIFGLWSKGEQSGLMRRMITQWFDSYADLLVAVENVETETRYKAKKDHTD